MATFGVVVDDFVAVAVDDEMSLNEEQTTWTVIEVNDVGTATTTKMMMYL